jgi:hypothetical protein
MGWLHSGRNCSHRGHGGDHHAAPGIYLNIYGFYGCRCEFLLAQAHS